VQEAKFGKGAHVSDIPTERLAVSIATYNERENLTTLIEEIHRVVPSADILVIDDNSPDGTGQLADELASKDSRIHVLHRAGKLGLGTAILAGVQFAIANDYGLFLNMDADFSHHPRYLPALLAGMQQNDVMIGSRYIPGGGVTHWPLSRRFMSKGVNFLVRLLFRMPVRDASGGFRCYRVSKLREANLDSMYSRGYSFQQEMLYRCWRAGCSIGETPIVFEDRRAGASKADPKEIIRSLSMIIWVGIRARLGGGEFGKKAAIDSPLKSPATPTAP
jgi:dolichol-phosphate mannosyltransferase